MKHYQIVIMIVSTLLISLSVTGKQKYFHVQGTIPSGANENYIYLVKMKSDSILSIDSTLVKNGQFQFKGFPFTDDWSVLVCGNYPDKVFSCEVILNEGKIQVAINDSVATIIDGALNGLYARTLKEREDILTKYHCDPPVTVGSSMFFNDSTLQAYKYIMRDYSLYGMEVIRENRHNIVGKKLYVELMQLNAESFIGPYEDYRAIYDLGTEEMKNDPKVKYSIQSLENKEKKMLLHKDTVKIPGPPKPFKDFTLYATSGDSLNLSQLVGNSDYLIVEFWASWCAPCKQMIPFLKELYQENNREGLDIISISLDSDENNWLNELEKQQMPWKQFIVKKDMYALYDFHSIPFTLVIDKKGNIDKKWFSQAILRSAKEKGYVEKGKRDSE